MGLLRFVYNRLLIQRRQKQSELKRDNRIILELHFAVTELLSLKCV